MDLDGKVAVVTGGGRGGGAAMARALAAAGARVVVNYARSAEGAEEVARETGGVAVQADVATPEGAAALVAAAERAFGAIDVLVNNASYASKASWARPLEDLDVAEFDRVVAVDLRGTFLATRAAMRALRARRGAVVNVASSSALQGDAETLVHNPAKAGIVGFTRSLARAEAPHGVRVNAVAPGSIDTGWIEGWGLSEADQAALVKAVPLRRVAKGEELAAAVVFLSSPAASYMTGQTLVVDGGAMMQ